MTLGLRTEFIAATEQVLSWDIEMIVPCHGDIIYGKIYVQECSTIISMNRKFGRKIK